MSQSETGAEFNLDLTKLWDISTYLILTMYLSHKIELKPNNKQKTYLTKACGTARFAYNWALSEWNRIYEENKGKPKEERTTLSGRRLRKQFNAIKDKEFPWIRQVSSYPSAESFDDIENAFRMFFKKIHGYPIFKKKGQKDKFRIPASKCKVDYKHFFIPSLGPVKMAQEIRFDDYRIISATISRKSDKWFISFNLEVLDPIVTKPENKHVGVDLGIKNLMVTSDGHIFSPLQPMKKNVKTLKRTQKRLSKKIEFAKKENRALKDSKNFQKEKKKLSKIHYKILCQRSDVHHKVTSFLVNNYSKISIEDLNVAGMIKNHNLARGVSDVGFGTIRRVLEYKTKIKGNELLIVGMFFPSSKMCSGCGEIKEDLKLSQRTYNCSCGVSLNRDYNAALNLRSAIGRVSAKFKPVEMSALQKSVHPIIVTRVEEAGNRL